MKLEHRCQLWVFSEEGRRLNQMGINILSAKGLSPTYQNDPVLVWVYYHLLRIDLALHCLACHQDWAWEDIRRVAGCSGSELKGWAALAADGLPEWHLALADDPKDLSILAAALPILNIPVADGVGERLLLDALRRPPQDLGVRGAVRRVISENWALFSKLDREALVGLLWRHTGRDITEPLGPDDTAEEAFHEKWKAGAVAGADATYFPVRILGVPEHVPFFGLTVGNPSLLSGFEPGPESARRAEKYLRRFHHLNEARITVLAHDGLGTYVARKLSLWALLQGLEPYPVERPWENPIERVWNILKDKVGDTSNLEYREAVKVIYAAAQALRADL